MLNLLLGPMGVEKSINESKKELDSREGHLSDMGLFCLLELSEDFLL